MVLNPQASYPSARSYVLQLHRDSQPPHGDLRGRVEHIASGRHVEFGSAAELLERLRDLLAQVEALREE